MKKFAAIIAFAAACCASLAAEKPWLSASAQNPKEFFSKATDLMRKIYPDPQAEMTLALSLSPLGYPNFDGVAGENFGIAAFGSPADPLAFAAVKASKESVLFKFAQQANMRRFEKGGWLVVQIKGDPSADVSKYADETIAAASEKDGSMLSLRVRDSKFLASLPAPEIPRAKKMFESFKAAASGVELVKIAFDCDGNSVRVKTDIYARENSDLANLINALPLKKRAAEAAFIPQGFMFSAVSSANGKAAAGPYKKLMRPLMDSLEIPPQTQDAIFAAIESSSTSASALDFKPPAQFESVSVAASAMPLKEIAETAERANAAFAKNLGGTPAELPPFKAQIREIDGMEICETSAPAAGAPKIYMAKEGGYLVSATSLEAVKAAVEKIKNPPSDYPLKKYAASGADFAAAINNSRIMKAIFSQFGVDFDGKVDNSEAFAFIERNSIKIRLSMRADVLRAYADIFRKIAELNAAAAAESAQ